jgi:hypothetical protein
MKPNQGWTIMYYKINEAYCYYKVMFSTVGQKMLID